MDEDSANCLSNSWSTRSHQILVDWFHEILHYNGIDSYQRHQRYLDCDTVRCRGDCLSQGNWMQLNLDDFLISWAFLLTQQSICLGILTSTTYRSMESYQRRRHSSHCIPKCPTSWARRLSFIRPVFRSLPFLGCSISFCIPMRLPFTHH